MAKALLIALTKPVSPERDAEFNEWYNNVHVPELLAQKGFNIAKRYRIASQLLPPGSEPAYSYIATYEVDDAVEARLTTIQNLEKYQMSDAFDMVNAIAFVGETIFESKNDSTE